MQLKEHLTENGLQKIVAIKAFLNLGISDELKSAFPDIIPVKKSLVTNQKISDPNWLAGFTSAEGCFSINLLKSPDHRLKERIKLIFQLSQHSRDEQLMVSLINYLDCGNVIKNRESNNFKVTKFWDIQNKIVSFFINIPSLVRSLKILRIFVK